MTVLRVTAEQLERQARAILDAWGLPGAQAEATARLLVEAELAGIESHGVGLLTLYAEQLAAGRAVADAEIRTAIDRGAMAVLDGGGGFGHRVSLDAAELAADKAAQFGVGAVAVRNSNHFGAAGLYVRRIAARGQVGLCTTAVWRPAIVPTGGSRPMLGTNPIAFAAPGRRNPPFLLDMATSTAAIGKTRVKLFAGQPVPEGWAIDETGAWERDPEKVLATPRLSPLGGDEEHGGHKGYGLAAMVELLSTTLAGSAFAPLRPAATKPCNVGHFFLAIDPLFFREDNGFEDDLDDFVEALRGSPALDEGRPVQVAGDPEYRREEERRRDGIPLPPTLVGRLREIASAAGAAFLLDGAGGSDGTPAALEIGSGAV